MPVPNATYICPLTPATSIPGQPVFGINTNQVGVITYVRQVPAQGYAQAHLECLVRWPGGTERWYPERDLHDYDTYIEIIERELMGLYGRRGDLEQRFGIIHRPTLKERP